MVLTAGCSDDPPAERFDGELNPDLDFSVPTPQLDLPPVLTPRVPLVLEPQETRWLPLRPLITDPDSPFETLGVLATPDPGLSVEAVGDGLEVSANGAAIGFHYIRLTVTDPTGASVVGRIVVSVEAPHGLSEAPPRVCGATLYFDASANPIQSVAFVPVADGPPQMFSRVGDDLFALTLDLSPGRYPYELLVDERIRQRDPQNPYLVEVEGETYSALHIADCERPLVALRDVVVDSAGGLVTWVVDLYDGSAAGGIELESLVITVDRTPVSGEDVFSTSGRVEVQATGLSPGRHTLRMQLTDRDGLAAEPLYAPVWLESDVFIWQDALVYAIVVDRFANGDERNDGGSNDGESEQDQAEAEPIASWQGGDWAGVITAIEAGYFDELGVNVLWITSPVDNPDTLLLKEDGRRYASFHGLYPTAARSPENHYGTLETLQLLTRAAHDRGIRVIADLTLNHVHEEHPYFAERDESDDFNPQTLCRPTNWDQPTRCWFEAFLPDLNTDRSDIVARSVDDALWWVDSADLDGFRIDGVSFVARNASYDLRVAVDRLHAGSRHGFFVFGDLDHDAWSGANALGFGDRVSPGELNAELDFAFSADLLRTTVRQDSGFFTFGPLEESLQSTDQSFGRFSTMGTFLGHRSRPRVISQANGDIVDAWGNGSREQGFVSPPHEVSNNLAFDRSLLGHALLLTLPGVPYLFYADEVGLAGAGSPDNQRMMPAEADLTPQAQSLRASMATLGRLRSERIELRRGLWRTLLIDGPLYAFARTLGSATTVVVANLSEDTLTAQIDMSSIEDLEDRALVDAFGGPSRIVSAGVLPVEVPARGVVVLSTGR